MNKFIDFIDGDTYQKIIQHRCTKCGKCCTWPGFVPLFCEDVRKISCNLNLEVEKFLDNYCCILHNEKYDSYSIIIKKEMDTCPFLIDNLCSIHFFKPITCKAGPFGWNFINNSKNLDYFMKNSPSFDGMIMEDIEVDEFENLFLETWQEEYIVSKIKSIEALAVYLNVEYKILLRLDKITYDQLNHKSYE